MKRSGTIKNNRRAPYEKHERRYIIIIYTRRARARALGRVNDYTGDYPLDVREFSPPCPAYRYRFNINTRVGGGRTVYDVTRVIEKPARLTVENRRGRPKNETGP